MWSSICFINVKIGCIFKYGVTMLNVKIGIVLFQIRIMPIPLCNLVSFVHTFCYTLHLIFWNAFFNLALYIFHLSIAVCYACSSCSIICIWYLDLLLFNTITWGNRQVIFFTINCHLLYLNCPAESNHTQYVHDIHVYMQFWCNYQQWL